MYVKAYYRRGSAHLALNQIDKALKDFKTVCKMQPGNKDAREKYDYYIANPKLVEEILVKGAQKTRPIAIQKLKEI